MTDKDNTKVSEPLPDSISLWIDWNTAAQEQLLKHVNQMLVQDYDGEVFVSFFAFSPPVTHGTPDEQIKQLKGSVSIKPECVVRMVMSRAFVQKTIAALQEHLEKVKMAEESRGKPTDE